MNRVTCQNEQGTGNTETTTEITSTENKKTLFAPKNGANAQTEKTVEKPEALASQKDSAVEDGEEPASAPNKAAAAPKKQRPPNPMFDAVAAHVFGITSAEELKEMNRKENAGSRIGQIVSWLGRERDTVRYGKSGKQFVGFISSPAEPDHVRRFVNDYVAEHEDSSGNSISPPRDPAKFVEAWRAWASKLRQQAQQDQGHVDRDELDRLKMQEYKRQREIIQNAQGVSA